MKLLHSRMVNFGRRTLVNRRRRLTGQHKRQQRHRCRNHGTGNLKPGSAAQHLRSAQPNTHLQRDEDDYEVRNQHAPDGQTVQKHDGNSRTPANGSGAAGNMRAVPTTVRLLLLVGALVRRSH